MKCSQCKTENAVAAVKKTNVYFVVCEKCEKELIKENLK